MQHPRFILHFPPRSSASWINLVERWFGELTTKLLRRGTGKDTWVTVYIDPSHAFLVVDGRAFDTADCGGPNIPAGSGPRWRANPTGHLKDRGGYDACHPAGL